MILNRLSKKEKMPIKIIVIGRKVLTNDNDEGDRLWSIYKDKKSKVTKLIRQKNNSKKSK